MAKKKVKARSAARVAVTNNGVRVYELDCVAGCATLLARIVHVRKIVRLTEFEL